MNRNQREYMAEAMRAFGGKFAHAAAEEVEKGGDPI